MFYYTTYDSPIDKLTLVSDGQERLVGLWIENQKYFADKIDSEIIENSNIKIFNKTKNWLDSYFKGEKPDISELSLKPKGNLFRQRVWQVLSTIPYGKVYTYGEIAKIIAKDLNKPKMSAQAIGGAVGHNPISIIIPCHRVVSANGKLTGYAGGIDKKIFLLKHEKAI